MLRIFLSPTRSGSGAFLRCFENNPEVDQVYHQPIKSGYRQDGVFDYSWFDLLNDPRTLVAKETIGGFEDPETKFSPLPGREGLPTVGAWYASPDLITTLEPIVLLRDPVQTWASIERLNQYSAGRSRYHSPYDFFLNSYRAVAEFALEARRADLPVWCVTQEMLALDIYTMLKRICDKWKLPWHRSMVDWTLPYGEHTWFSEEAIRRMRDDPRFQKSKESLAAAHRWDYRPSSTGFLDPNVVGEIEAELRCLYNDVQLLATADFGWDEGLAGEVGGSPRRE